MFQTNAVNGGMGGGGGGQAQQHGPSAHYSTGPSQQGGTSNGAPPSNGAGGSMAQLIYPALHLQPLNDTFAPKQICLAPPGLQNKVKIGRQTNNKTLPQPSNGYFDSKVLSRMHAEVWSQDGKVYIKDVKSSNGTFINGARLSPEGQESDTFELHTDDVVEFGIDIVSEDNKSIIHHKVACRVFLVMTAEEALGLRHDFAALYRGGIAGSTLNHHAIGPGAEGGLRRSKMAGNGTGGYAGGVGGGVAGPNGMMSFDHILHRLQAELQKSKDTAGELGSLNAAMSDIGETLGGGLPPMQHPPYQHLVPSSSAANSANEAAAAAAAARDEEQRQQHASESSARAAELRALEEQVRETQKTLQAHIDRLAAFEARVEDNESIKGDLLVLREQVNRARFEEKEARSSLASRQTAAPNDHSRDEDDVDDNASVLSVDTVVPQEGASSFGSRSLEVDEVDSLDKIGQHVHSKDRGDDSLHASSLLHRLKDHVGPLAPPDGVSSALDHGSVKDRSAEADTDSTARNDDLSRRLEAMENQLERALEIGRTLADQHAEATDNVRKLEDRIKSLETEQQRQLARSLEPSAGDETAAAPTSEEDVNALPSVKKEDGDDVPTAGLAALAIGGEAAAAGGVLSMLESKWGKWRETFETEFAKERAGMSAEREDLRRVVRMWDTLNQEVEDLVEGAHTDDGGANGDESPHVKSASAVTTTYAATNSSKKKKKRKGGNASNNATVVATPVGVRRSPGAVGLGASAELNRHLRALIYTDDYNLLVRETHMESDSSTSASSSVSDTSRSVTSKTTDDTSVGSVSGGSTGGGGTGTTNLDDLPDGVRKRAMGNLASSSGRRKPARTGGRWPEFGSGSGGGAGGGRGGDAMGHGFDHPASLPVLGAAGVAVVAMTAWIMAGRGMNLAGGPGG